MMSSPAEHSRGSYRILIVHDADPVVFAQRMANILAGAAQLGHLVSVLGTGINVFGEGGVIEHWAHVSVYVPPESARKAVAAPEGESKGASHDVERFAA
jgi:hypothetical protein